MESPNNKIRLNIRQRRFCHNYVQNGGIGAKAAIDAGYSKRTAAVCASKLLIVPNVANEIERLEAERRKASSWTRQNYLESVAELMRTTKTDSVKCRCLEIIGKAEGFLESDGKTNVNIGLFDALRDAPQLPTKSKPINIDFISKDGEGNVLSQPPPTKEVTTPAQSEASLHNFPL